MSKPTAKAISARLQRLARERGATFAEMLTQFLIERAVARLVSVPFLDQRLVFKAADQARGFIPDGDLVRRLVCRL